MILYAARKWISIFVTVAFFSMVYFYSIPLHANQPVKTEKQEKVKAVGSETEAEAEISEYYSRDDAHVIEKEGQAKETKKKFPWLPVIGGAVLVGVVLYFTVIKTKKYELTVDVGEGVTGTPITSGVYKKGTVVNFNYSPQSGYEQVSVMLDGSRVDNDGWVKMDSPHSITVTAMKCIPAGDYSGTTNQGYPVTLKVNQTPEVSMLVYYRIKMASDVNDYGYSIIITLSGDPGKLISGYVFSYQGMSLDLTGAFALNGNAAATGEWKLHYNSHIYGVFTASGTYNATLAAALQPGSYSGVRRGTGNISVEIFKAGRLIKRVNH